MIFHGVYPEPKKEILRSAQNDIFGQLGYASIFDDFKLAANRIGLKIIRFKEAWINKRRYHFFGILTPQQYNEKVECELLEVSCRRYMKRSVKF